MRRIIKTSIRHHFSATKAKQKLMQSHIMSWNEGKKKKQYRKPINDIITNIDTNRKLFIVFFIFAFTSLYIITHLFRQMVREFFFCVYCQTQMKKIEWPKAQIT